MVFSQLFEEDSQQAALRRAQHEQAMAGLRQQVGSASSLRGSLSAASNASSQLMLQSAGPLGQTGLQTGLSANAGLVSQLGSQLSNQLGSQFTGQLGGSLSSQLGGQLSTPLGSQLAPQLGGQLGAQLGTPSLLDVQRAENILAAAAMANNACVNNSMSQLALMNATASPQAALLQSRLGGTGSFLGPNTPLPLAQEASFLHAKNQALSLATTNGMGIGVGRMLGGVSLEQDLQDRLKRKLPSEGDLAYEPLRKALNTGADLKLPSELVDERHGSLPVRSAHHQIHQLMKIQEETIAPKTRKKAKTFPVKLMQALMENPNEDAVAWLPDGKSFVIVQPDMFVEGVLKRVFKECKYASFVRKLHRWGFVRLTSGTGTDCFHHPLFQKNRIDMCAKIICTPRDSSKASEAEKRAAAAQQQAIHDRPPSLAGVEKFFRTKALTSKATGDEDESNEEKGDIQVAHEDCQLPRQRQEV